MAELFNEGVRIIGLSDADFNSGFNSGFNNAIRLENAARLETPNGFNSAIRLENENAFNNAIRLENAARLENANLQRAGLENINVELIRRQPVADVVRGNVALVATPNRYPVYQPSRSNAVSIRLSNGRCLNCDQWGTGSLYCRYVTCATTR
ncbi:MAG: hypothetical protein LBC65_06130 [Oscillospiraceae bacterium]|jgi:hypothetical protein|nr:hypothetical protein [Oscillospiraceae bacterium]